MTMMKGKEKIPTTASMHAMYDDCLSVFEQGSEVQHKITK